MTPAPLLTPHPRPAPPPPPQQSVACAGLCSWVIALEKYDKVIKEVEPKRQKLREAEAQLEVRGLAGLVGGGKPPVMLRHLQLAAC